MASKVLWHLFSHLKAEERILKIKCLTSEMEIAKRVLAEVKPCVLIPPCSTRRKRTPRFTREFPKPCFSNQQMPKRNSYGSYTLQLLLHLRQKWPPGERSAFMAVPPAESRTPFPQFHGLLPPAHHSTISVYRAVIGDTRCLNSSRTV